MLGALVDPDRLGRAYLGTSLRLREVAKYGGDRWCYDLVMT